MRAGRRRACARGRRARVIDLQDLFWSKAVCALHSALQLRRANSTSALLASHARKLGACRQAHEVGSGPRAPAGTAPCSRAWAARARAAPAPARARASAPRRPLRTPPQPPHPPAAPQSPGCPPRRAGRLTAPLRRRRPVPRPGWQRRAPRSRAGAMGSPRALVRWAAPVQGPVTPGCRPRPRWPQQRPPIVRLGRAHSLHRHSALPPPGFARSVLAPARRIRAAQPHPRPCPLAPLPVPQRAGREPARPLWHCRPRRRRPAAPPAPRAAGPAPRRRRAAAASGRCGRAGAAPRGHHPPAAPCLRTGQAAVCGGQLRQANAPSVPAVRLRVCLGRNVFH